MTGKNYFLVVYRVLILILYKVQKSTHTKKEMLDKCIKIVGINHLIKWATKKFGRYIKDKLVISLDN